MKGALTHSPHSRDDIFRADRPPDHWTMRSVQPSTACGRRPRFARLFAGKNYRVSVYEPTWRPAIWSSALFQIDKPFFLLSTRPHRGCTMHEKCSWQTVPHCLVIDHGMAIFQ